MKQGTMMTLNEFWSVDKSKTATIILDNGAYGVEFYENNELIEYRTFPNKSLYYAESAAENFTTGILRFDHESH
jgi:thiamine pyrophosphate-dependent acetolactate synthase large subunit-like protein